MPSVFTRIIQGELPCYRVYEDDLTLGFLTRDAIQLGHSLIVPKIEIDLFTDVPEPYYSAIFVTAKRLAKAIQKATNCKRVGTVIAGWDVPHCHCHLIPMFDYYDLDPRRAQERTETENRMMQSRIIEALKPQADTLHSQP